MGMVVEIMVFYFFSICSFFLGLPVLVVLSPVPSLLSPLLKGKGDRKDEIQEGKQGQKGQKGHREGQKGHF